MDTDSLREIVAENIRTTLFEDDVIGLGTEYSLRVAGRVLAIPAIKEALAISAIHPEGDYRDYLLRRGRWAGVANDAGYV